MNKVVILILSLNLSFAAFAGQGEINYLKDKGETTKASGNESLIFESIWKMSSVLYFIEGPKYYYPALLIKNIQQKGVADGLLIPAIKTLDGLRAGKSNDLVELFFPTIHNLNPRIGKFLYEEFSISIVDFKNNRENFEREERKRDTDEYNLKRKSSLRMMDWSKKDYQKGEILGTSYALNPSISSLKINEDVFCLKNCFSVFKMSDFLKDILGPDFSEDLIPTHLTADTKDITLENYKNWVRKYFPAPRGPVVSYPFPDPKYPAMPDSWEPVPPIKIPVAMESISERVADAVEICKLGVIGERISKALGATSCYNVSSSKINSVTSLDLSYKKIESIPENAFQGFISLKTLNLRGNLIKYLPKDAFSILTSLESLDLGNNEINEIPNSAFVGLNSLEYLNLDKNPITTIYSDLVGLNSTVEVEKGVKVKVAFQNVCERGEIIKNYITNITHSESCEKVATESMAKILEIDLSNKEINEIPTGAFKGLDSVTKIILANNNLSSISSTDAFNGLNKLEEIDLSSNQFSEIPVTALKKLTLLKKININSNKIKTITEGSLIGLAALQEVDFSKNEINDIAHNAFQGLPSLKKISFKENNPKISEVDIYNIGLKGNVEISGVENVTAIDPNLYKNICSLGAIGEAIAKAASPDKYNCNKVEIINISEIKELDLSNKNFSEIPDDFFEGFKSLEKINLSNNNINNVSRRAFVGLTKLEELDLSKNHLTDIPTLSLKSLKHLKDLNLASNKINAIPNSAFVGLNSLKSIKLGENPITTIDRKLVGLNYGVEVEGVSTLKNVCERGEIGEEIARITNSKSCDEVDPEKMEKIKEINLSNKNINEIPTGAFIGLDSVEKIILANNNLSSISSDAFNGINKLKEIDLSSNQLSEIPVESLKNFTSLKKINIKSNKIKTITEGSLIPLSALIEVNFSNNEINAIVPGAFLGLPNLKKIILDDNQISEVDFSDIGLIGRVEISGVNVAKGIRRLYKSFCSFGAIGEAIAKATLSENCNKVEFVKIYELEELDLSNQNISEIPYNTFFEFGKLRKINLSNNNINKVSTGAFNGRFNLEELDLSKNHLIKIPSLKNLIGLLSLNLANNSIEKISSKAFTGLNSLKVLDVRNNLFTSLDRVQSGLGDAVEIQE